jgi:hypothetical protein
MIIRIKGYRYEARFFLVFAGCVCESSIWGFMKVFICLFVYQAHAAAAILNFSESCMSQILAPYLDAIVSKLLILLQVIALIYCILYHMFVEL